MLILPHPLPYLLASNPKIMSRVLTIVHWVISPYLVKRAGMTVKSGAQNGTMAEGFVVDASLIRLDSQHFRTVNSRASAARLMEPKQ